MALYDINKTRLDFPILSRLIYNKPLVYLDNAATTQKPQCVIDDVVKFYTQYNSNIHRGVHFLAEKATEIYENARIRVKEFINASSLRSPEKSFIIITHYQKLLDYIVPDVVHVLYNGRIIKTGDKNLALEIEQNGFDKLKKEADNL